MGDTPGGVDWLADPRDATAPPQIDDLEPPMANESVMAHNPSQDEAVFFSAAELARHDVISEKAEDAERERAEVERVMEEFHMRQAEEPADIIEAGKATRTAAAEFWLRVIARKSTLPSKL